MPCTLTHRPRVALLGRQEVEGQQLFVPGCAKLWAHSLQAGKQQAKQASKRAGEQARL